MLLSWCSYKIAGFITFDIFCLRSIFSTDKSSLKSGLLSVTIVIHNAMWEFCNSFHGLCWIPGEKILELYFISQEQNQFLLKYLVPRNSILTNTWARQTTLSSGNAFLGVHKLLFHFPLFFWFKFVVIFINIPIFFHFINWQIRNISRTINFLLKTKMERQTDSYWNLHTRLVDCRRQNFETYFECCNFLL